MSRSEERGMGKTEKQRRGNDDEDWRSRGDGRRGNGVYQGRGR